MALNEPPKTEKKTYPVIAFPPKAISTRTRQNGSGACLHRQAQGVSQARPS